MRDPDLRLDDLIGSKWSGTEEARMLSVKLPVALVERIERLARLLPANRAEVIAAVLNEGLIVAEQELRGYEPPPEAQIPKERRCTVRGCHRETIARGLCATHYQAQRRARMASQTRPAGK